MADALKADGAGVFVESWYRQPMWASLATHPRSVLMLRSISLAAQAPRAFGSYLVNVVLSLVDVQV